MHAYKALEARFARLDAIGGALAVLGWDHAAVMPEGGARARGEQRAELGLIAHELLTAPETAELLDRAAIEGCPDDDHAANLRLMRREHARATALPSELVAALARATNACEMVWRRAREEDDFAALAPSLAEVLNLVRESAAARAERFGTTPYGALLDGFEEGLTPERVEGLFAPLIATLPGVLDAALERQARGPAPRVPRGPFPIEAQFRLVRGLMERLGFDFTRGRLDESHHPFCGGVPDDIRITTRYDVDDPLKALMAVLHETGHALYEAGRPPAWRARPLGEARGMMMHESQSLLIEMLVCRSPEFMAFLGPALDDAFGADPAFAPDNLLRLHTRVSRGLIRVDADEVSYPLHVVLRTRLERDMVEGRLDVRHLPEAWRAGMRELLCVEPPNDRLGCLQDVHWPAGAFGYFPCYTLGALAAAQLYEAALAAEPGIPDAVARGDFAPLVGWLRANVHGEGSRHDAETLIRRATTGRPLYAGAFLAHVEARYGTDDAAR